MKSGPPPKPTRLKILTGNPGKGRLNKREPVPPPELPTCPSWLPAEARNLWRRIVPQLHRLGLLGRIDREALTVLCQTWARWRQAADALNEAGNLTTTVETKNGITYEVQRPEVTIERTLGREIRSWFACYGLTPADRARLEVPEPANGGSKRSLAHKLGL